MWYVYLLKCVDGNLYSGCTEDIEARLDRHNSGYVSATKYRLPVSLICYITFTDKYKAFEFERDLKSGSGRAFISRHFV